MDARGACRLREVDVAIVQTSSMFTIKQARERHAQSYPERASLILSRYKDAELAWKMLSSDYPNIESAWRTLEQRVDDPAIMKLREDYAMVGWRLFQLERKRHYNTENASRTRVEKTISKFVRLKERLLALQEEIRRYLRLISA